MYHFNFKKIGKEGCGYKFTVVRYNNNKVYRLSHDEATGDIHVLLVFLLQSTSQVTTS